MKPGRLDLLRDRSFLMRWWGGAGGIWGGVSHAKKKAFEVGHSKKIRERGSHVKCFSKSLKWRNVLIFKKTL